jgi:tryptophan 2,3-dioxygenase
MKPTVSFEAALKKLQARYGERAPDYIEGAAIRREVTYDDYIHTDTLLSLQKPLTDFHDEVTFLIYHQQTELWFRLCLHEMEAGIEALLEEPANIPGAMEAATRMNRILKFLTQSFDILIDGLSTEEFMEFRMAFGASSGFQSAQFRAIELMAGLERHDKETKEETFYWERAARDKETGEPTLTLLNFKEKHLHWLNVIYENRKPYSLRHAFAKVLHDKKIAYTDAFAPKTPAEIRDLAEELVKLDKSIIDWKGSHYVAAAKHLAKAPRGTGETNWKEYLSRSIKEEHYFPELVSIKKATEQEDEIEEVTLADA